jgi:hypothetical protein
MNFQQAVIVGLILTTSYDYKYGLSAGHDCKTDFRASLCYLVSWSGDIHNDLLILLTVTLGL